MNATGWQHYSLQAEQLIEFIWVCFLEEKYVKLYELHFSNLL